jgi:DNA-binding GntR family transcriptional regulator
VIQARGPDDDGLLTVPERVGEWIYRELRRRILMGHLPPGSRLSVPALAREFGVSRSPVRDAVLHLVRDGLGQETLNRGAIVRRFSPENLVSLYEAMEALEGMAARLAADRSDGAVHRRLTDMVHEHPQADAFHREIWTAAASPVLSRMLEDIQGQLRLAMCSASLSGGNAHTIEDHQEVLEAIASGDADASEAAARRHVVRLRAMLWEVAASPRFTASRGAAGRG